MIFIYSYKFSSQSCTENNYHRGRIPDVSEVRYFRLAHCCVPHENKSLAGQNKTIRVLCPRGIEEVNNNLPTGGEEGPVPITYN